MFEAQSRNRMGLLLWMSHPAWPSFVWQTYDYYFDPTAAYFGSRKGSEPLHVQWNPVTDDVEVVNYSAGAVPGLAARAEVLDLDGTGPVAGERPRRQRRGRRAWRRCGWSSRPCSRRSTSSG